MWTETLPLGNGRIGAMVYGGTENEIIQFNEETLWTGQPHDYANKGVLSHLVNHSLKYSIKSRSKQLSNKTI